jgi:hypothetical protein
MLHGTLCLDATSLQQKATSAQSLQLRLLMRRDHDDVGLIQQGIQPLARLFLKASSPAAIHSSRRMPPLE